MLLTDFFHTYPEAFVITMAILGLVVGSFLNVVIYRLPVMMEREWRAQCKSILEIKDDNQSGSETPFNLVFPRSRCPHCGNLITALENIPVISYLLLKGKCKNCRHPISPRYPVVELIAGILTAFIAWHFGFETKTFFAVLLTWALICLSFIDLDHQLLPDDIVLPFLWLGIICNMFGLFTDIYSSLLGAIFGYGILWLIFISYKLLTGKEGMGYGDFKLLAMLGAWSGWQMLPLIILLSSMLGAIVGISLIIFTKHGKNIPIPFGPYLTIAGWTGLLWGQEIMQFYLRSL